MNGAFYIGATGLDAQQRALDVIANNIANINTPAYKRSALRFSELYIAARDPSDLPIAIADRSYAMSGAMLAATPKVWTEGVMQQTGQALDLAISGTGFIEIAGPSGQLLLSRGGSLKVNADGYLASADGLPLREMISVPDGATSLTIAADGTVSAVVDATAGAREIGRIELVTVTDPDQLVDQNNGYYEARDETLVRSAETGLDGAGTFVQGALEQSNLKLSDEMVTLLLLQRAYAANAQVVQAGDQLMSIVNGLRR